MSLAMTFFLIDDDEDDQQIFSFALSAVDRKINFLSARDGAEAIEMIKRNEFFVPDFIFLDLNMPRMGGIECLVELKKMDHLKQSRIIIYTTSADQRDRQRIFDLGAHDFRTKPSNISDLKSMIHEIIQPNKN